MYASVRIPAWDQWVKQCLANWICVLQCLWSQHPYGAWNNKQLCVFRDFMYVCSVCLPVYVGGMAAERFINPVHQGSVGFTLRHQRLKDVSATQARQRLPKILIWALIFYHNNPPHIVHPPPQQTPLHQRCFYRLQIVLSAEHYMFMIMICRAVYEASFTGLYPICQCGITGLCQRCSRFKDPILVLCSHKHISQPRAREYSQQQNGGKPGVAITKPWLLLCPRAGQYMAILTLQMMAFKNQTNHCVIHTESWRCGS